MRVQKVHSVALSGDSILRKATRVAKSKRGTMIFIWLTIAGLYMNMINTNLERRSRLLADHQKMLEAEDGVRDLITTWEENGDCNIGNPTEDALPAARDATRTLLASYPGSGKRFTWTIIKALTNSEVADDWNFSEKLYQRPLTIKTSWPHKEGVW